MDGEKVRGNNSGWGEGKGEQLWMGRRLGRTALNGEKVRVNSY
jgi:hypothetical protein